MGKGHLSEGRQWLEATLALAATQRDKSPAHAKAFYALAVFCRNFRDAPSVLRNAKESAALAREINDQVSLGWALILQGIGLLMQGEPDQARAAAEEAVTVLREGGYAGWDMANVLLRYAFILASRSEVVRAQEKMEAALTLFRQLGDRWGTSQALNMMGDIARIQGDYDRANTLYTESLHLYRELGVKRDIPASLDNLGHVALARGDNSKAQEFFREGLTLHQDLGNKFGASECVVGLAGVAAAVQQPERAARLLGIALRLREGLRDTSWRGLLTTYERYATDVRTRLDEASWSVALQEGQAMSMEQAIAYALDPTAT